MSPETGIQRSRMALLLQASSVLTSIGFAVASARWLGPSGKGMLTLIITAGGVAGPVLSLGIPQALTTWVARDELTVRAALRIGLSFTALLSASLFVFVRFAAGSSSATPVISLLWLSAGLLVAEQVVTGVATGIGRMRSLLFPRCFAAGAQVIAFSAAWLLGLKADIPLAVGVYFAMAAVGLALAAASSSRKAPTAHGDLRAAVIALPSLVAFGLAAVPAQLLTLANYRADILLLGWLSGPTSVGVYSLAVSATLLVGMVPAALAQALTRNFGASSDPTTLLRRGLQASLASGVVTALAVGIASWLLVVPVFGRPFAQASVLIAVMLPFTALFAATQVSFAYFYSTLRRPALHSAVIGVTAAVDALLIVLLAPTHGAVGAAVASAVAYGVGAVVNIGITSRYSRTSVAKLIVPSSSDAAWILDAVARAAFPARRVEAPSRACDCSAEQPVPLVPDEGCLAPVLHAGVASASPPASQPDSGAADE